VPLGLERRLGWLDGIDRRGPAVGDDLALLAG
jgi:hypothetical protein